MERQKPHRVSGNDGFDEITDGTNIDSFSINNKRCSIAGVLLICGIFLVSRNSGLGSQKIPRNEEAEAFYSSPANILQNHQSSNVPSNDPNNYGWYIYKTALVTKNGTVDEVFDFMFHHTGGWGCDKVNLGCSGYKISCSYGDNPYSSDVWDRQIHYVHAPKLFSKAMDKDDLGVDGWQDLTVASMADFANHFSAFMHNKVQMYTIDLDTKVQVLEKDGYSVMKRLSYWSDGVTLLGHASVQVSGKVWEFVGYAPDNTSDWRFWGEEECPLAHKIDQNITRLQEQLDSAVLNPTKSLRGNSSFWISVQVASSIQNSRQSMVGDLLDLTGAIVERNEAEHCSVITVSYKNSNTEDAIAMGDQISLKFVENTKHQGVTVGGKYYSLEMYENYINKVHGRYLQEPHGNLKRDRWRNWDHWLDQHVGVKYYETEGCYDKSKAVTSRLLENDNAVGKRAIDGDGDHYYTGYDGSSMCIEYNTEQCHYGIGETDTCTCNRYNSNELEYAASCDHDNVY